MSERIGQFYPLQEEIMISVKTYIKNNNEFVEFSHYTEAFKDSFYIEGAIELTINGVVIFDKEMWDYIDQLWSYIADGIICIQDNHPFETYFPDQPIKVSFMPIKEGVSVSVTCDEEMKVKVAKKEFVNEISKHVIAFFDYLRKKDSSFDRKYDELVSLLGNG